MAILSQVLTHPNFSISLLHLVHAERDASGRGRAASASSSTEVDIELTPGKVGTTPQRPCVLEHAGKVLIRRNSKETRGVRISFLGIREALTLREAFGGLGPVDVDGGGAKVTVR